MSFRHIPMLALAALLPLSAAAQAADRASPATRAISMSYTDMFVFQSAAPVRRAGYGGQLRCARPDSSDAQTFGCGPAFAYSARATGRSDTSRAPIYSVLRTMRYGWNDNVAVGLTVPELVAAMRASGPSRSDESAFSGRGWGAIRR